MKKTGRKRNIYYLILILSLTLIAWSRNGIHTYSKEKQQTMQQDIAKEIIRFHIIANSDSQEDQNLKMQVKEQVVETLRQDLQDAKNITQAKSIIQSHLGEVEETAVQVMKENGYSYGAKASLAKVMFPVKFYGDMVFPAGEYQALRVELGDAKGQNWWCVMFPSLCFVDGTYSVVPDKSKNQLKEVLTEEEYEALLLKKKGNIKVKFKLVEWYKNCILK